MDNICRDELYERKEIREALEQLMGWSPDEWPDDWGIDE